MHAKQNDLCNVNVQYDDVRHRLREILLNAENEGGW